MKIISYNVNGIRAAIKKGLLDWIRDEDPDIICIQETKANKDQVETHLINQIGYNHFWFSAEKKGYSGVAIFSKIQPLHVEYGTGIDYMDKEGRVIRADFKIFSVISLYLPSVTNIERLGLKFTFMDDFKKYIYDLNKKIPNLIVSGDYNICHKEIDIHDPVRNKTVSGFLPEERDWLTSFMGESFIDSFRVIDNSPHSYSWWSYRAGARKNNKGWRIDYNIVSKSLEKNIKNAYLIPKAVHSDHCPVALEIMV